jgi:hypothetical protein
MDGLGQQGWRGGKHSWLYVRRTQLQLQAGRLLGLDLPRFCHDLQDLRPGRSSGQVRRIAAPSADSAAFLFSERDHNIERLL